jgi:hypothetical protein
MKVFQYSPTIYKISPCDNSQNQKTTQATTQNSNKQTACSFIAGSRRSAEASTVTAV